MDDETIFEFDGSGSRQEIAASLRAIAAQLSGSGPISLNAGDEAVSVQPADDIDFEVEVEGGDDTGGRYLELEVELGWLEQDEVGSPATAAQTDPADETGPSGANGVGAEAAEGSEPGAEADAIDLEADFELEAPEGGAAGAVGSLGTFEVFRDRADEWRWRLVYRNGNVIANSGEGYTRRRNAEKGLRSVVENAPGADVIDDL